MSSILLSTNNNLICHHRVEDIARCRVMAIQSPIYFHYLSVLAGARLFSMFGHFLSLSFSLHVDESLDDNGSIMLAIQKIVSLEITNFTTERVGSQVQARQIVLHFIELGVYFDTSSHATLV